MVDPGERGLALGLCRALLSTAATGYGLAVRARNACYNRGWRAVHRAGVPVISIGNITAGGTGKTPFAAWLVGRLKDWELNPAILSRGYGRDSGSGLDDENRMLSALAPDAPIVVGPDRVRGAARAVGECAAGVLVLDDGFQHRRLARDLDIVLVDALAPLGGVHLLPRGLLREPLSSFRRADVIVITRSDLVPRAALQGIKKELRKFAPRVDVALAAHGATGLLRLFDMGQDAEPMPLEALKKGRWAAFCGVGNPEAFRITLERLGAELTQFSAFPDHYRYRPSELSELLGQAAQAGCRGLVTTEKDAIKVERTLRGEPPVPVLALQVRMEIVEGRDMLEERILSAVGSGGAAGQATPDHP